MFTPWRIQRVSGALDPMALLLAAKPHGSLRREPDVLPVAIRTSHLDFIRVRLERMTEASGYYSVERRALDPRMNLGLSF